MIDIVIKQRDLPGERIGMEDAAAIERERYSVGAADVLHHHLQGFVGSRLVGSRVDLALWEFASLGV